ncbi:sulfotransferase family protein [Rosistilla oblonga]|uniref:sulfotransferase family protein n=1 Tax=Rosistilla oblonga TaxID=2527990 RepID=UPI003A96F586
MFGQEARFPVFVTGTQRSGTTLMHHILDCSSQFWSRNEMYPVHQLVFGRSKPSQIEQLRQQLNGFLKLDLPETTCGDNEAERVKLLATALDAAASKAGKPRWCLKDPAATYYLQEYATAFPDAKFVIMIRDPRAVCRSYLSPIGFTVGRPANWIAAAERWTNEVEGQISFANEHPDRVMLMHYESAVSQLGVELRRLCSFCEIPNEPALHLYYKHESQARIHNGNRNILTPPDPAKADKWKSTMSKRQMQTVESIAMEMLAKLRYDAMQPFTRTSRMRLATARVHDRLVREWRWQMHKLRKQ